MNNWKPVDRFAPLSFMLNQICLIWLFIAAVLLKENIWPWYIYLIAGLIYMPLGFICVGKGLWVLRPWLDYSLILIALWGKAPGMPLNSFFLLFPLISTTIYTGRNVILVENMILAMISAGILWGIKVVSSVIFPIFILGFISINFEWRKKWMSLGEELFKHIDDYFSNEDTTHKPHEIYQPILNDLNRVTSKQDFIEISTYIRKNNNYFLINSSEFKWQRQLYIDDEVRDKLDKNKSVRYLQENIRIAGENVNFYNLIFSHKLNDNEYIVVYTYSASSISLIPFNSRLKKLLQGVSGRIVNLLDFTFRLNKSRTRDFERLQANKEIIDDAIGTMHFIRNKLSSIGNLLEYMKLPDSEKNLIPDSIVKKNLKSAAKDFEDIKQHANRQLRSNLDSVPVPEQKNIPFKAIFIMVSESAEDHLGITIRTIQKAPDNAMVTNCSMDDLRVFFTDIISNMEKYGANPDVSLNADDKTVSFEFTNGWQKNPNKSIIGILNDPNVKSRITQKKTHGTASIKEIAHRYGFIIRAEEYIPETETETRLKIIIQIPVEAYGGE